MWCKRLGVLRLKPKWVDILKVVISKCMRIEAIEMRCLHMLASMDTTLRGG